MFGISGKYRVDTRLGGGGMAEVFLGSMLGAEGFSRKVAIKRVLPGFSDNPAFAQMFVAEAQISAQLQHPNIVSVLDFDRDAEQRLFLVMELVEGRDLDSLVSSGLLPIPLVIYLISEVLRGLGHAHDLPVSETSLRGIIHRDVSPHNVLLSWEGAVKVSDFGIAKAREASAATASLLIKGKPAYMSPEQANGEQLDGRSDLFAVGVMLWEMLVGRRLFMGEDTRSTLAAVLFGQVPRPRSLRGDVPKDLERVVMKLLERDLPARYPTAEAAIGDLLDCTDAPKSGRELLTKTLAERFPATGAGARQCDALARWRVFEARQLYAITARRLDDGRRFCESPSERTDRRDAEHRRRAQRTDVDTRCESALDAPGARRWADRDPDRGRAHQRGRRVRDRPDGDQETSGRRRGLVPDPGRGRLCGRRRIAVHREGEPDYSNRRRHAGRTAAAAAPDRRGCGTSRCQHRSKRCNLDEAGAPCEREKGFRDPSPS